VLSVSCLFFDGDASVCGCMCVYAQTHTHIGVLGGESRGKDKTTRGPEESRWTKSGHICIHICVHSTHVYTYAGRRTWTELIEGACLHFSIS